MKLKTLEWCVFNKIAKDKKLSTYKRKYTKDDLNQGYMP